jgi:hypothetical protein
LIDFRYHLVSIVAVFLALSIGIVIGATELRAPVANRLTSEAQRVAKANSQLVAQNHQLTREINADNAFGQASASYLLSHLLEGQKVVLVTAPGADTTTVTGITTALRLSGAIVIGQVNLTPQFLDTGVSNEQTLTSAARRLAPAGIPLPGSVASGPASGQQAAARVLAAAIMTKDGQATAPHADTQTIVNGLGTLGFLQVSSAGGGTTLADQATLAVVAIPANPPGNVNSTDNLALVSLTQDLQQAGQGALLAGSIAGSGPGSAIQAVTSGAAGVAVTTVDFADSEIGQIVVVQELSLLLGGHATPISYGVGPLLVPSPAPSASPTPSNSGHPKKTNR